ncbi:hypothetical protein K466DRAFT_42375 [Polyporus arcularius HHB13444]|uniref:Uncharacterized protein n=1 Tax=Polyporus arcularius HHB13444 TaxID=1314778 RepID=A0A5C3PH57_9APHY|nr:hypothetical protein K466DRAFT_42375 [Polyporus arcularius HHB13444]
MRQQREHEKAVWDRQFLQLVPSLLQLAAPHLETLALLQSDGFAIPTIQIILPRLRELTLLAGISATLSEGELQSESESESPPMEGGWMSPETGYSHFRVNTPVSAPTLASTSPTGTASARKFSFSPSTASATSSLGDRPHGARFPALKRLHVVCGRHRDWTLREPLAHLMLLAPALTHLRISNTTYTHGQDDSIPAFLRDALGIPHFLARPGDHDASGTRAPMLAPSALLQYPFAHPAGMPGLRRVVLHSVPPPAGGRSDNTHKDYRGLVGAVQAIADTCESSDDVRVRWIEGERMRCKDWEQLIRAQWMDRITGGCGCWEDDRLKQTLQA